MKLIKQQFGYALTKSTPGGLPPIDYYRQWVIEELPHGCAVDFLGAMDHDQWWSLLMICHINPSSLLLRAVR